MHLPPLHDTGLAPLTVGRPPAEELASAAAAAGFGRVGLTLRLPDGGPTAEVTDARRRRRLRHRLDDLGLRVLDAGVLVVAPGGGPADDARLAEAAADLGADRLVALVRDEHLPRAAERLATACATAAAAGLSVGVEPMPYSACRTLEDARALVRAAGAGGVVVDVLHLFRSGGTAADLAVLDPAEVVLVQLCDARAAAPPPSRLREEALGDRRYPGSGELPLGDVLAALPDGLPVTVESPVAADAGRTPAERARSAAAAVAALRG